MAWYNFWKKEPARVPLFVDKSQWRNNMWVMSQYGVGILFTYGQMCTVHLVDNKTGETTGVISAPLQALRQAKFKEIPEVRRVGFTSEKAKLLGYF
jgi:hypothetical protein